MDRLITLNGKTFKAADFDLNLICDFEDAGISLEQISDKMFNVIRQYIATSMGVDPKVAGNVISEHLKNGGSLDEISNTMSAMMEDSGFFRQKQTDENQGSTKRTRTKKTETGETEVTS